MYFFKTSTLLLIIVYQVLKHIENKLKKKLTLKHFSWPI